MTGSTARLFGGNIYRLRHSIVFLMHIHLQPPFCYPSDTRDRYECQSFFQPLFKQMTRRLLERLTAGNCDKLALTVLTPEALLAIMSASIFDNL